MNSKWQKNIDCESTIEVAGSDEDVGGKAKSSDLQPVIRDLPML